MLRSLWSFRNRYRILHLSWFAFFLSFVVWFNMAPLATTIQQDLKLTTEQLKVLAICNLALTIPARIVGGVVYLTVYNFTNTWTLFSTMGVVALICASLCGFFLQEPSASFAQNNTIPKVEQSI